MTLALLTAAGLSLAGLVASLVLGHLGAANRALLLLHVTVALFTTLLALLVQSMVMFYLIGKGKAIKDAVAEGRLEGPYAQRVWGFHMRLFPIATYAVVVTMAAAIVGGGVATRTIPAWIHAVLAYGALGLNTMAVVTEARVLADSARLVDEINSRLRE